MLNVTREYDLDTYIKPYWEGNTVSHESVMFLDNEFKVKLLFPADEILAVLSSDLKTEYVNGKDYTLEDGCFVRPAGSAMPVFPLDRYYPDESKKDTIDHFNCVIPGKPYIFYGEKDSLIGMQVDVTYTHSAKWAGIIPEKQNKFGHFLDKVNSGAETNVLYFGDSITTGCNSSALIKRAPFAEIWPKMLTSCMKKLTGNESINYANTACGGMGCEWGTENVNERVISKNPDLMVLAFGMNDGYKTAEEFIGYIDGIIKPLHAANPDCEVCLVSTMLPNSEAEGFLRHHFEFEPALESYSASLPYVGLAPMTSIHKYMLERKKYHHMTGNNVNHPNDFITRAYAMAIKKVIFG